MQIDIQRSRRRTITLTITPDAAVLVKAPLGVSDNHIHSFIEQHSGWIEKNIGRVKAQSIPQKKGNVLYLGKLLVLTAENVTGITPAGDKLLFPKALLFRKEKELNSWYVKEAKRVITAQVQHYAKEMQVLYREITFSDTKSQWGRCTHDNRLQFSWRLVMAPMLVLTYVVVHELAHITQKNHTLDFWLRVRQFNPSYRQQVKWLKDHGSSLKVS